VVPPVCEDGDPPFCDERLHEDEHAEGEGDEGEGEVVEDGHGSWKGFLGGAVGVGYYGCEGGSLRVWGGFAAFAVFVVFRG
jgi:hypothetical protein